jgi:hypothetical protein
MEPLRKGPPELSVWPPAVVAASVRVQRIETLALKARALGHDHTLGDLRQQLAVALAELEEAKAQAVVADGLAGGKRAEAGATLFDRRR